MRNGKKKTEEGGREGDASSSVLFSGRAHRVGGKESDKRLLPERSLGRE